MYFRHIQLTNQKKEDIPNNFIEHWMVNTSLNSMDCPSVLQLNTKFGHILNCNTLNLLLPRQRVTTMSVWITRSVIDQNCILRRANKYVQRTIHK